MLEGVSESSEKTPTKRPGPDSAAFAPIVLNVQFVLRHDIVHVQFNQGLEHRYHPCQRNIGDLLVWFPTTYIAVDTWKPHLH